MRTAEDMVDYLIDCTLATVEDMCWKKSISKSEFERQCSIAQTGYDFLGNKYPFTSRAKDIKIGETIYSHYSAQRADRLSR